jgi:TolB-like protein
MKSWILALSLAFTATFPALVGAAPPPERHVVAILDFETGGKEISSFSKVIPDLLAAFLAGDERLQLVERATLKNITEELALGQTGLVDEATRARIGKLTGAKFLVTGRAFIVGNQLYITAKIIGTETGKVAAQLAKGPIDGELDVIVQDLASKMSAYMAEHAQEMLPSSGPEADVLAELHKKLDGHALPKFAVIVSETHVNRPIADPAVQTEVSFLLRSLGATLVSSDQSGLSDWAKQFMKETGHQMPTGLKDAEVLIVGEGISEYAGTTNNLISAKARVELKVIDIKSGKVLAVGRQTATAVDLAENIAAKSALQKAASQTCLTLLPQAVTAYEANKAGK